jgi:hypothetical protein
VTAVFKLRKIPLLNSEAKLSPAAAEASPERTLLQVRFIVPRLDPRRTVAREVVPVV